MSFLSEAAVEQALLDQLSAIGYSVESEEDIGPDGHRPERESHDEVILKKRFEEAVARLNPGLPLEARQDAVRRVMQSELPSLLEENRRLHKLVTEGVDVEYYADDGTPLRSLGTCAISWRMSPPTPTSSPATCRASARTSTT